MSDQLKGVELECFKSFTDDLREAIEEVRIEQSIPEDFQAIYGKLCSYVLERVTVGPNCQPPGIWLCGPDGVKTQRLNLYDVFTDEVYGAGYMTGEEAEAVISQLEKIIDYLKGC
jgi:hypothetical protein